MICCLVVGALLTGCAAQPPAVDVAPGYRLRVLVPGSAMHGVHGLAFDADDRLYGASLAGYSVYEIDTQSGEVDTVVGPPLGNADDVAVGPDGTLAWTAGAMGAVHALTPDGELRVLADGLPAVNSIGYAPDGRLFVTQVFGGDALWEIDPSGQAKPRRVARRLGGLNGFEVTAGNQLYGPLFMRGKLVRVDLASGEVTEIADGFSVPAAVNVDSRGRLWVVDFDDGHVVRLDRDGGGRKVVATLEPPLDNLAIDSTDQVYVSNPATNTITALDPATGATRVVTEGHLSSPGGIALVEVGGRTALLVADLWGNRYFDAETGARTMLPSPRGVMASASLAAHDRYLALASIWPLGLVYLIDRDAQKIVKTGKFRAPYSPVFDRDGSLLVADYEAGTITRLAPGDSRDKAEVTAGLAGPAGLVLTADRALYVSEYDGGRVVRVDPGTGRRDVLAEGLDRPEGLALDGLGRVLVAETGAGRLLRIEPATGGITTLAAGLPIGLAGGPDVPAPFLPTGIAVDDAQNIYLSADVDNALLKLELVP